MACRNCGGERIAQVSAKCSDLCCFNTEGKKTQGYVPGNMRIGGGDYIAFRYCLDCGQIQDEFPVSDEAVKNLGEE